MKEKRNELLNDMILPKWIRIQLPESHPCVYIYFEGSEFHVSHDNSTFNTCEEAYRYAAKFRLGKIIFDPSVNGEGGALIGLNFHTTTINSPSGEPARMVMIGAEPHNESDKLNALKSDYLKWLTTHSLNYINNPDDVETAEAFLNNHPVFWTKETSDKSYDWTTHNGLEPVEVLISREPKTNSLMMTLSHGSHTPPEYTSFRIDEKLTTREETYNQAIIELARKVNALFDLDGYYRQP